MFQLFKDCIAHPRNIAQYVDRPNKKFIGFFIILILIYIFPIMLIVSTNNSVASDSINQMSQSFAVANDVHYEIKDGKLVGDNMYGTEYVKTEIVIQNRIYDLAYVFDLTGQNYHIEESMDSSAYILVVFQEDHIKIFGGSKDLGNVASEEKLKVYQKTYEQLGISNIAFNDCKGRSYYEFNIQFTGLVNSLFKSIKNVYLPLLIVGIIIGNTISYLVLLLTISLLELLFYHMAGIKFGKIFKICAYASTPYLVLSFIGTLTGLTLLNYIGQFILVLYAMKALSTYAILNKINKL